MEDGWHRDDTLRRGENRYRNAFGAMSGQLRTELHISHGHCRDIILDGYWFDVTSALAAAEELSTLRVSAR